MTRATFKVLFYVKRTKPLKDGTVPIFARVTVNKMRTEFSLQMSIEPQNWDAIAGRAIVNSKQNKEINSYLDAVKANLLLKKRELEEMGTNLTAEMLKNAYLGLIDKQRSLIEVFTEHNQQCKQLENIDFAPGTIVRYEVTLRIIKDFLQRKYKKNDILLCDIKPLFIDHFEVYLKTTRKCAHNTSTKYLKNLKKIINISLNNGWIKSNPFANIRFRSNEVNIAYLTEKELDLLMKKPFTIERVEQVKDIYLFCCFTGLSFSDVKSLCSKDIIEEFNQLWIKKKRKKTKNWCHIPLLEPALKIIEKYQSHPYCVMNGVLLPVTSNQKMNAYLKEIADLVGIDKKLSTHTARHTFATTVTLGNQVSMEVVSKMLGHSSIKMTQKYARVVDDLISKDMMKLHQKYEKVMAN